MKLLIDCIPLIAALLGIVNTLIKYLVNHKKKPEEVFKFLDNGKGQDELTSIKEEIREIQEEIEKLKGKESENNKVKPNGKQLHGNARNPPLSNSKHAKPANSKFNSKS